MRSWISVLRGLALSSLFVCISASQSSAVTFFSMEVEELARLDSDSYCLTLSTAWDPEWETWFYSDPAGRADVASILKQLICSTDDTFVSNLGFPGDPSVYSENYDPSSSDRTTAIFAADWRFETLPTSLLYYFDYAGPASTLTFDFQADFMRGTLYSWSDGRGDWFEASPETSFSGSFLVDVRQYAEAPEPASFLLLAGGLAGLSLLRRRR